VSIEEKRKAFEQYGSFVVLPPDADKILARVVQLKIKDKNWFFTHTGQDCTAEMGLADGMLPLLWWKASQAMNLWRSSSDNNSNKAPAPWALVPNDKALLGVVMNLSSATESVAMWALHIDYILDEKVRPHIKPGVDKVSVPIDDWAEEWMNAYDNGLLPIINLSSDPSPVSQMPQSAQVNR